MKNQKRKKYLLLLKVKLIEFLWEFKRILISLDLYIGLGRTYVWIMLSNATQENEISHVCIHFSILKCSLLDLKSILGTEFLWVLKVFKKTFIIIIIIY